MNFLKSILFLALSMFLIASISAIPIADGEWHDGSNSLTITNGETASFNVYFATTTSPMTISAKLYNSDGNLIETFIEKQISESYYFNSNPIAITSGIYSGTGNFDLILSASDRQGTSTITIYLTVNPIIPANYAPVISSAPVTSVNENAAYSYDVEARDADGNALIYSLAQNPSWLSINANTGMITGTSPSVNSDTEYSVTVQVSDGRDSATQTFTLKVNNNMVPTNNPPVLTLNGANPQTIIVGNPYTELGATATDAEDGTLTYLIVISGTVNINVVGAYTKTYSVIDSDGNTVSKTRTVNVVSSSNPDTTPPVITITSPEENRKYKTEKITIEILTDEDAYVRFRLDEGIVIKMGNPYDNVFTYTLKDLSEGKHSLTFYATDDAGNTAKKSTTFYIEHDEEEDDDDSGDSHTRIIDDDFYYKNKYYDQFSTGNIIYTSTPVKKTSGFSALILLYIILAIIGLGIIAAFYVIFKNIR